MEWNTGIRHFCGVVVSVCVFIFFETGPLPAQDLRGPDDFYRLVSEDMNFSRKQFQDMKEGKVVTKLLDSRVRQEVAVFGISRINVPREFFIRNYRKDGMNWKRFSQKSSKVWLWQEPSKRVKSQRLPARQKSFRSWKAQLEPDLSTFGQSDPLPEIAHG